MTMPIGHKMPTGHTRLFAILADPVDHVKAPLFFNPAFAAAGHDAFLVPLHVRKGELAAALDALQGFSNVGGVVLTIPHKEDALPLCREVGPAGRQCGAVNAIRFGPGGLREADMFDGVGFVGAALANGIALRGRRLLMVGAGGAGRAMAFALAAEGPARLTIANRTHARAEELAAEVRTAVPGVDAGAGAADPSGYDVIINATSLGLHEGDDPPVPFDRLAPYMDVADIVVTPEWTPFLLAARERGCRTMGGRPMIDHQLDAMVASLCSPAGGHT